MRKNQRPKAMRARPKRGPITAPAIQALLLEEDLLLLSLSSPFGSGRGVVVASPDVSLELAELELSELELGMNGANADVPGDQVRLISRLDFGKGDVLEFEVEASNGCSRKYVHRRGRFPQKILVAGFKSLVFSYINPVLHTVRSASAESVKALVLRQIVSSVVLEYDTEISLPCPRSVTDESRVV